MDIHGLLFQSGAHFADLFFQGLPWLAIQRANLGIPSSDITLQPARQVFQDSRKRNLKIIQNQFGMCWKPTTCLFFRSFLVAAARTKQAATQRTRALQKEGHRALRNSGVQKNDQDEETNYETNWETRFRISQHPPHE